MKIAIASDGAAYQLKQKSKAHLEKMGHNVVDFGAEDDKAITDYPEFAFSACQSVLSKECDNAILICGTGIGMSMSANKIKGIRCAVCSDTFSAKMTRLHNDANVLAIGARVVGEGLALDIIDSFINTEFSFEERHVRRIGKITKIENGETL